MQDFASQELREQCQAQLRRVRTMIDQHCQTALAKSGGRIKPAAALLGELVTADAELQREQERLKMPGDRHFARWFGLQAPLDTAQTSEVGLGGAKSRAMRHRRRRGKTG